MIRCIAMDLDDTLLRDDLTISAENQNAIQSALNRGIKIVLASGRMVASMHSYAVKLGLDMPLIAYNGAMVREAVSGETLYHKPVPQEIALQVIPIFQELNFHLNVYLNERLYVKEWDHWSEQYQASAGVTPHPAGDLQKILSGSPTKMLGIGTIDAIEKMREELERRFGPQLDFTRSKPNYLEILAPGVSKRDALQFLAKKWGIDRTEVMAIGDAPNDLAMILWAGVGVAMANAVPDVRKQADVIVSGNNHNGVAEAIKKYVLG
jgi:Cof subfamily protein (haloacid dehalogenase superfamily)